MPTQRRARGRRKFANRSPRVGEPRDGTFREPRVLVMSPRSQTQKEFWWFGGRMRGSRPKSRAEGAPRACANLGRIAVRGSFTRTRKEMAVRTREALNQWTRSFGWGSLAGQLSRQEFADKRGIRVLTRRIALPNKQRDARIIILPASVSLGQRRNDLKCRNHRTNANCHTTRNRESPRFPKPHRCSTRGLHCVSPRASGCRTHHQHRSPRSQRRYAHQT